MDGRFKGLIEQSGLAKILAEHAGEYGNGSIDNTDYPEIKKLVELIVKECINELETAKEADRYTGELFVSEKNTILDEQITWLKEHFDIA